MINVTEELTTAAGRRLRKSENRKQTLPTSYTPPTAFTRRVVLKFKDEYVQTHAVPYDEKIEDDPSQYLGEDWFQLAEKFHDIGLQRLVRSITPAQIEQLTKQARLNEKEKDRYKTPNFLTYFAVQCPSSIDTQLLAQSLREWNGVEFAYVESCPTPPPLVSSQPCKDF